MYQDMILWLEIRRKVLVEGVSKRQVLRETGMHWTTLEKILSHSEPPGYRAKQPRPKPKVGPYLERIGRILDSDKELPKKQRHTAKRVFERLSEEEGYQGGYTAIKEAVRELRRHGREVFMPLVHRPGEAQVDFGYALAKVSGRPNEKGVVEGTVKYARQNHFVPVPQVSDLEELNGHLRERCEADLSHRLRKKTEKSDVARQGKGRSRVSQALTRS